MVARNAALKWLEELYPSCNASPVNVSSELVNWLRALSIRNIPRYCHGEVPTAARNAREKWKGLRLATLASSWREISCPRFSFMYSSVDVSVVVDSRSRLDGASLVCSDFHNSIARSRKSESILNRICECGEDRASTSRVPERISVGDQIPSRGLKPLGLIRLMNSVDCSPRSCIHFTGIMQCRACE